MKKVSKMKRKGDMKKDTKKQVWGKKRERRRILISKETEEKGKKNWMIIENGGMEKMKWWERKWELMWEW